MQVEHDAGTAAELLGVVRSRLAIVMRRLQTRRLEKSRTQTVNISNRYAKKNQEKLPKQMEILP